MAGRLAGKTALVTAAAQGIGRATAEAYLAEGAQVIATDVNADALAALDGRAGATLRRLDVTDRAAIEAAATEIGAVDVLFNCAGWVAHGALLETSDDDWARSFEINVTGMFLIARAFLPAMRAAGGGAILNMASVASSLKGIANRCAYSASKAAVIGLTKSIAADYVSEGIRCNAICPGTVQTPSLDERIAALGDSDEARAEARAAFVGRQPMGRLGTPQEIAALCVYLATDEAAYMTGSVIAIDGGITM